MIDCTEIFTDLLGPSCRGRRFYAFGFDVTRFIIVSTVIALRLCILRTRKGLDVIGL